MIRRFHVDSPVEITKKTTWRVVSPICYVKHPREGSAIFYLQFHEQYNTAFGNMQAERD